MTQPANKYRKHLRIKGFDYRDHYAYFVTICTSHRQHAFGEIDEGIWQPTRRGLIASECWIDIPNHHPFVELDAFVIMPNHIHGILSFVGDTGAPVAATPASPLRAHGPLANSLGSVLGSYKSAVSRNINKLRPDSAKQLWQPNYYEHIIRNDRSMDLIREYIDSNPDRWDCDEENGHGTGTDRLRSFIDSLARFDEPRGDAGVAATGET
jgi:putative transposase